MSYPALVFPKTVINRSTLLTLWPLFEPICIVSPPSFSGLESLPRFTYQVLDPQVDSVPSSIINQSTLQSCCIASLVQEWEQWLVNHEKSAQVESIKAGIEILESEPKIINKLRNEIKTHSQPKLVAEKKEEISSLSKEKALIWLYLFHQQDQQIEELNKFLLHAEAIQQNLKSIIGLDNDLCYFSDSKENFMFQLLSSCYSLDKNRFLSHQIKAWATLAKNLDWKGMILVTDSLLTNFLLCKKANRRFISSTELLSSMLGNTSNLNFTLRSNVELDYPLAQEVFQLNLPDLSSFSEVELLDFRKKLENSGELENIRQRLAKILGQLVQERWSLRLKKELFRQSIALAKELDRVFIKIGLITFEKLKSISRILNIVAFPGITRENLINLMLGNEQKELPKLTDWPTSWPIGSFFLAVLLV